MSIDNGPIATIEPRITTRAGLEGNEDVLDLRVREQRLDALPASDAGPLHAAERQLDTPADAVAVDEHLARADTGGDAVRAAQVARPHAGDEAVGRGIGLRDRVAVVLERARGQDRAEDLLLDDLHVGRDVRDQRGREEQAAAVLAAGDRRARG